MKKTGWVWGVVLAVLIACGGVAVSGCGGEGDGGYLDGTGCVELKYTQFSWDSWGWGWQCGDKGYSATCKLENYNKGVNVTCDCLVAEGTAFDGSGGKIFSSQSWNESIPISSVGLWSS